MQWPGFEPGNLHSEGRELTPLSSPLTATCAQTHKINKSKIAALNFPVSPSLYLCNKLYRHILAILL